MLGCYPAGSHRCAHGGIMRATTSCRDWEMRLTMPVRSSWATCCSPPWPCSRWPARTGRHPPQRARHHRRRDAGGALPEAVPATPPPHRRPGDLRGRGRAWATTPDGLRLWCLFEVRRPGPFLWGPRGDRVVLDGLEVRGVGTPVWRPARADRDRVAGLAGRQARRPRLRHAGRPQPDLGRPRLDRPARAHPVPGRLHLPGGGRPPVGEALAFVLQREGASEIWMASNAAAARSAWSARPGPGWGRWPSRPAARPCTTGPGSRTAAAGSRSSRWPRASASPPPGR